MVKRLINILLLVLLVFAGGTANGELIISEVMSNEPGGSTSLEWIELYNDSTGVGESLIWYGMEIDGNFIYFTEGGVGPLQYVVLCKDTIEYEAAWGDGDGIWEYGTDPFLENYLIYQVSSFSLVNDSGRMVLFDRLMGIEPISEFVWDTAGQDGVSWERIFLDSAYIGNSNDPSGGTPGRLNSITPLPYDLALLPVTVTPYDYEFSRFEIKIANIGLQSVAGNVLTVSYDPDADGTADSSDLIGLIDYGATTPGDTLDIEVYFLLEGLYPDILLELPDDNRLENNYKLVKGFGVDYPPIIISEFLADPKDDLETEWVEIKNRTDSDVDLNGWFLGDEKSMRPIITSSYIVPEGGYVVLCDDSSAFGNYYEFLNVPVIQLSSWAVLDNDGDKIRLRDNFGIVVDNLNYSFTYGGNYAWGRSEDNQNDYDVDWGRSIEVGGTPGEPNEIYLEATSSTIEVVTEPNPFSPMNDGLMSIEFKVPPGDNLTLKIYDLEGRIVRTLIDGVQAFEGFIDWDGTSDDGQILNIGMYILYLEISGIQSYKQTVVIAP